MTFKAYKIRNYGKPDLTNANQLSNPKTPQEKVQAIADLLETRLKGEIVQQYAERGLLISDLRYALGTDGESLTAYDTQLEKNFQGMAPKSKNHQTNEAETAPELKKVSNEKAVKINVPGAGGAGPSGGGKTKKK